LLGSGKVLTRKLLGWETTPPSMMDIVTALYPESKPKGELRLRPCLVTATYQDEETSLYLVEIAYGTKNLKAWARNGQDLIVQNSTDLDEMGLPVATRFVLDQRVVLRWSGEVFGCWDGKKTPKIGALTEDYQKEYAYCMMKILGAGN
jgi:hypothetical protein